MRAKVHRSRARALAVLALALAVAPWVLAPQPAISASAAVTQNDEDDGPAPEDTEAAKAPGKAGDDVWPKPVKEFLEGEYLNKADIVLTRRSGDIASYIIRWATGSLFSHAAMVYTAPPFDTGISETFVIEAGTGGVDLTKLSEYVRGDNADYVAIRRLKPKPWFDAARQARVRGVLLDKIKARYDFWTIWKITRNIWFGVQSKIETRPKTVERYRKNKWQPPNEYICTGLLQIGFVETLIEAIKRGEVSPEALRDVVFTRTAENTLPEKGDWKYLGDDQKETAVNFREILNDDLFSVTPEDIAQTDKLDWIYLVRKGAVHKITSYADVTRIVNQ